MGIIEEPKQQAQTIFYGQSSRKSSLLAPICFQKNKRRFTSTIFLITFADERINRPVWHNLKWAVNSRSGSFHAVPPQKEMTLKSQSN